MKKILNIFAVLALFVGIGCQPEHNKNTGNATFSLAQTEINATADGMNVEVAYVIENPQEGAVVLTECKDNWIKNLSTATAGKIKFAVAPNYTQKSRETKVVVQYTAVEAT